MWAVCGYMSGILASDGEDKEAGRDNGGGGEGGRQEMQAWEM